MTLLSISDDIQRGTRANHLIQWLFVFFLLLVFVGFQPFSPRDLEHIMGELTGEGDVRRQVGYLFIFAIMFFYYIVTKGLHRFIATIPVLLWVGLCWIAITALWSVAPELSVRRAVLTITVALTVFMFVDILQSDRVLELLRPLFAVILIVNFVSVFIIDRAIHGPAELDPGLVGAWRGMHLAKGVAGVISIYSAFVFLYFYINQKRISDILLFIFSVFFIIGTKSDAPTVWFFLCLFILPFYVFASKNTAFRSIIKFYIILFVLVLLIILFHYYSEISLFLGAPGGLTGRGAIWNSVWTYLFQDWSHWVLGAGFGAFWEGGGYTSLTGRAAAIYMTHSHNGALEVWVETGLFGLTIVLLFCVIFPLCVLLKFDIPKMTFLMPAILFFILINSTETYFFYRDKVGWVMFLISIAIMRQDQFLFSRKLRSPT